MPAGSQRSSSYSERSRSSRAYAWRRARDATPAPRDPSRRARPCRCGGAGRRGRGARPAGPKSEVYLVDLLMDLGKSAVPSEVDVSVRANGEPCKLVGHYDPLRRAFANLLRNAAEAMGGRGSIEIAVSRDGNGLAVTIADHGGGIPDDLRQRVFEPYFTTKRDGTGLGLALVRQTIEAHNGTITVAETPGGGATFSIVLSAA